MSKVMIVKSKFGSNNPWIGSRKSVLSLPTQDQFPTLESAHTKKEAPVQPVQENPKIQEIPAPPISVKEDSHQESLPQSSLKATLFDKEGEDENEEDYEEDELDSIDVETRGRSVGTGSKYTTRGVRFKLANFDRQH
jgi:hypothetical protein